MAGIADVVTVEWAPASDQTATSPTWVDITSNVEQVSISRGRAGAFDLYGSARCSITLKNTAPTIDPTVWYRGRQVRVTATATGPTTRTLFRGFVQNVSHDQGEAPFYARASIEASDLLSIVGRYEYNASGVPEELTGARIDRVCTAIGIPRAWCSVDAGFILVGEPVGQLFGVATPGILNVNALAHLQDVAECEGGGLYVSADGVLTFEDRYTLRDRLLGAATVTFSDTAAGSEVPYVNADAGGQVLLTPPGTDYRNSVTFIGASSEPQTASDVPANFFVDSLSRTLPMARDTQAQANAEMLLEVFRQTGLTWPISVTVHMYPGAQASIDAITALDLRRYCIVEFTPVGKTQQSYKVIVESIEHSIDAQQWRTRVGFSSGDRWVNAWITGIDFLKLNDVSVGQLDQEELAY